MSVSIGHQAAHGPLVLADISGYTSFLHAVAEAHRHDAFANGAIPDAYAVLAHLLDGIVARTCPPFTLAKVEGDAVFVYATSVDGAPTGSSVTACMRACYATFRERVSAALTTWTCRCDACARVTDLDLKFIVHSGPFVVTSIAGSRELAGPEVVLAHRLLKNGVAEALGTRAYALVTTEALRDLQVDPAGGVAWSERYDGGRRSEAVVFPLGG